MSGSSELCSSGVNLAGISHETLKNSRLLPLRGGDGVGLCGVEIRRSVVTVGRPGEVEGVSPKMSHTLSDEESSPEGRLRRKQ